MAVGKGSLDRVAKAAGSAVGEEKAKAPAQVKEVKAESRESKPAAVKKPAEKAVKKSAILGNEVYRVGDALPVHLL